MINNNLGYFKSILCLNGRLPNKKFFKEFSGLPIIAADGAGSKLINLGIYPETVIGDLDSFEHNYDEYPMIHFVKMNSQNNTDFEKSISFAKKNYSTLF